MDSVSQTLLLSTAVLVLAAVALAAFDMTQHTYVGFQWWTCALWLNLGGALCVGLLLDFQPGLQLAQLLWVPWPILCLLGLRRFHARMRLPGSARGDLWLLAGLCAGAAMVMPLFATPAQALQVPSLTAALALTYAAAVTALAPVDRDARGIRLFAGLWWAMAALPMLGLFWTQDARTAAQLHAGIVALGSLAMAFLVLAMSSLRTERELRHSRRKLRVLAHIDMLTQVPNRRRFEELARRALQADAPGSATLLLVDIDHFKQINDQLGHAAGDRALKLVSRCTLDLLRSHDVAGRHGGDEFVLLLRRSSTQHAMQVAERLVSHLQTQAHAHALPPLSLSFGIVQMRRDESIDATLLRADLALYEAKRLGRSRAVAADGDDDAQPVFRSSQRLGLSPG